MRMYPHDYVWGCQDRRTMPAPPGAALFELAVRAWWRVRRGPADGAARPSARTPL